MTDIHRKSSWFAFGFILASSIVISSLFLKNILRWGNEPDPGFFFRSGSGIDIIGGIEEHARWMGLKIGDKIISINGKSFNTIEERRAAVNIEIGQKNSYIIERGNERFELIIINNRFGVRNSFIKSGFPYLVGLSYVLIGVLVFLMKPHRHASWVFFIFGTSLGLLLTFLFKGGALKPSWLGTVHIFLYSFSPAVIIHLMLSFPKKRKLIEDHPLFQCVPYIGSAILFICIRLVATEMLAVPRGWYISIFTYLTLSLTLFLISCFQLWVKSDSEIVRARSKIILMSAIIATSVPIMDMAAHMVVKTSLVPGFNYYLPFLISFPVFIGYAITKYNLFDIDATIRWTFGYVLITIGMALIYTSFVFIPGLISGKHEYAKSPGILIGGFVIVFFLFNLYRNKIQKLIDTVFYRSEYDYEETLVRISAVMRTPMTIQQIVKCMVDLSKDILFIDHGAILLLNESTKTYEKRYGDSGTPTCLKSDEPILGITARRAREVSIYDIEEDPIFSIEKDSCRRVMEQFKASLIIPLLYEERMIGLMILGEKKSGKFYRRQDILLLTTLANQGAVAIENARLQDSFINALEISKRELQLLNKAKSKALDLLSHELKTPLSVISMNLELLKRDGEKEPDTQKRGRVFERLETHLKRLLAVQGATEKIIQSYDKVEKTLGEEEIDTSLEDDLKRFDLFLTIQKILESVKHRTSHRDLIYDFFGTLGSYIRMNPRIVEDVIESLLRNAIENTPDEGLIRVIIESTRKTCTLKVCDFGTGITEDNQKYLFEGLFYTQESELYSSKQPYDFNAGGKGLDLFRIKVYSRRFGFEVSMESKRCVHIPGAFDNCPGKISECVHCKTREDCLASGGSVFTVTFKSE